MSHGSQADLNGDAGEASAQAGSDDYVESLRSSLSVVLQPIVRVATGDLFAYEALARFGDRAPEDAIGHAETLGCGVRIELICMAAALRRIGDMPVGVQLSVNISPEALRSAYAHLDQWPEHGAGLIVEVTEHTTAQLDAVDGELAILRARGALLAVDDVGSGYAGLLRLAAMRPNLVKVDKSIVTGVHGSVVQSAVLESLVTYAHRIGAKVIAEGVETEQDLLALAEFDVDFAQGWFIGHPDPEPVPVDTRVVALCRRNRAQLLARTQPATQPADRTRSMHEAVSLMSLATEFVDLRNAIERAAQVIDVHNVAVSGLDLDGRLREVFGTGPIADLSVYVVEEFPTTARVLATGEPGEVYLSDSDGDVAEQRLLQVMGMASVLIVPFFSGDRPVGILEFHRRDDRHWTGVHIEQARGLALHLSAALERMARLPAARSAASRRPAAGTQPVASRRPSPRPQPRRDPQPVAPE